MTPTIAMLTDFGLSDPSVGEMKGVILSVAPGAVLVDVTHGVEAGNVREAAWILSRVWRSFPPDTCYLVVVDPGVGTERRAMVASAAGRVFLGPDNGVLLPAVEAVGGPFELREVRVRELDHTRRGTTFDGRDLFAPLAARIATGADVAALGPEIHDPVRVRSFEPRRAGASWETEIIRSDRYGNLVTTADEAFLRATFGEEWRSIEVRIGARRLSGIRLGYGDVAPGELLLSIGGSGTLEISVNRGSARRSLAAGTGDPVHIAGPGVGDAPVASTSSRSAEVRESDGG